MRLTSASRRGRGSRTISRALTGKPSGLPVWPKLSHRRNNIQSGHTRASCRGQEEVERWSRDTVARGLAVGVRCHSLTYGIAVHMATSPPASPQIERTGKGIAKMNRYFRHERHLSCCVCKARYGKRVEWHLFVVGLSQASVRPVVDGAAPRCQRNAATNGQTHTCPKLLQLRTPLRRVLDARAITMWRSVTAVRQQLIFERYSSIHLFKTGERGPKIAF